MTKDSGNPGFEKFTEQNWAVLDVLKMVAGELQRPAAEVALAWVHRAAGRDLDPDRSHEAGAARVQPARAGAGDPARASARASTR